jgi:hypothetical protein
VAITGMGFQSGTIKVTLPGDVNLDTKVDLNDLTIVLVHYNLTTGVDWATGDVNGDTKVDLNDLTIVLSHYNQTLGAAGAAVAPVPEPSALVLILAGAMGLLGYAWPRRKRGA